MKKILFALALSVLAVSGIKAQNRTFLIAESGRPYSSQTWFYSGAGNSLQRDKIKEHWDEGRRIIKAAWTNNGWFVTAAKNTGIGMQTYNTEWSNEWITEKWNDGYYITSLSSNSDGWLVVMSQGGQDYWQQTYNRDTWSNLRPWIKGKWDEGYYITDIDFSGTYWTVVMSKTHEFTDQGYIWVTSSDDARTKLNKEIWDKGHNIQCIEYGDGEYFIVYCTYAKDNGRGQNYVENPNDVNKYIQERWDDNRYITYIGGGY